MFRSRAARRASAPSVLPSKGVPSKGVRLEPHEVNQDDGQWPQTEENEKDEKEPAPPLSPEKADDSTKDNNQDDDELVLDNIILEEEAPPEAPSPVRDVGRLPPMAWIVAWKKREVWPHALASVQTPLHTHRYIKGDGDRLATAIRNRSAFLETRQRAARTHNDRVAHALLLRRDAAAASCKARSVRAAERLHQAEARRSAYVAAKQRTAVALMEPILVPSTPVVDESLWEASSRRIAAASAARIAHLHEKSARAGSILERAKSIAADVAALHDQYATLATHDLQQRLARAEVRRLIVLDKRRLLAGRHGNYVRSVYLTTKYLAREAGDRRTLAKDAATARRQVHLDAIAGRTRRHNLSVHFRSTCAHRLMDAQWLHTALASASAQDAAAALRAALLGDRLDALQAAAARREHVARQRHRETALRCRVVETTLEVRLRAAAARRSAFLTARTSRIAERRELLRARKWTAAHNARRFVSWALKDKLAQATKRREAVLERRRAACAARNWYARVVGHRHAEVVAERVACLQAHSSDKHAAAALRRQDQQRTIFCQLVGLRHERVVHVLATQAQHVARTVGRKLTLAALRVAELQHAQAQASHARWLHTQRVRERRDHLVLFRAQCLRSRSLARLRSAEIRRALQLAAIRAGADEAAAKRDAARLRVQFATESRRAHLEFRLLRADEKRAVYTANKVAAAIFFAAQGEIVRRRLASRDEARRLTYAYEMESAGLRQSIARTQCARSHLIARAVVAGRQKCLAEARAERGLLAGMRHENAADRRDEMREAKQETARRTTQRVTLARLERQSTDVVDAAVKTAMAATIALHAERRRVALLQARTDGARAQSRRARDVARVQKVARRIEALTLREQSQQRVDESAKRREMLLAQRKLGLSASLQPFAGLAVVGTAIPLPYSA